MFKLRAEAVYKGVTHKGFWHFANGRMETACGKKLPEGTYKDTNRWVFRGPDCGDCQKG
ncbi:hypothetical protein [Saccharopolyspora flava]|uniref:Uncharacterized protein n=1 Tax=Saccharopolyspora flava TaxID=95161 RepID=A0A1I6SV26_9PSEU|nr:hypothetical protein [Saccharopolyspora flava]SFS80794.1 hypothetical protein SAMN05660874_03454 [Saccharopolyspora flava]